MSVYQVGPGGMALQEALSSLWGLAGAPTPTHVLNPHRGQHLASICVLLPPLPLLAAGFNAMGAQPQVQLCFLSVLGW